MVRPALRSFSRLHALLQLFKPVQYDIETDLPVFRIPFNPWEQDTNVEHSPPLRPAVERKADALSNEFSSIHIRPKAFSRSFGWNKTFSPQG